jgi:hypothetical protein
MEIKKRKPKYKAMFILGISLIVLGISFLSIFKGSSVGPIFIVVGGLDILISIKNKDKWEK